MENVYSTENIAKNIKNIAKDKNISLNNMLKDLSLGINTVSSLYHGREISCIALARIADYLDVSLDYLMDRNILNSNNLNIELEKDNNSNRYYIVIK